jgi:hypothetical protein
MERAASLLNFASKKDDDARLVLSGDELFLETTQPLPGFAQEPAPTMPNPANDNLLMDAATAPLADIRIQALYIVFLVHSIACLACLLFALPIYYLATDRAVAIVFLCAGCVGQSVAYFVMIFLRRRHVRIAISVYAVWVVCWVFIVGPIAVLTGNVAPFQLVAMIWAESMVVIVYTKVSPRMISARFAFVYMLIAAVVIWGIFIWAFVIDHDWDAGLIILSFGMVCAIYHANQISVSEEHNYGMSWNDTVLSIIQFYGEPVLMFGRFFYCMN